MKRLSIIMMSIFALASCQMQIDQYTKLSKISLTEKELGMLSEVYSDSFISEIKGRVFLARFYVPGVKGLYNNDTREIFIASPDDAYSLVHEATHYFQDVYLHRSMNVSGLDYTYSLPLINQMNTEQEATAIADIAQVVYFNHGNNQIMPMVIQYQIYAFRFMLANDSPNSIFIKSPL